MRERGRERESVSEGGRSAEGGARRTCPFSLARGYRHGNWKRHFGRHHNLKLKCAASGEGSRGAEERGGGAGERGEANHKPISIPALGSSLPAPLVPHSNLSPENHFELDLLRASLKAALMCALKSRRSRSRTNTKTSLWSGNDGRVAERGCKLALVLASLPRRRRRRCLCSAQRSVGQFAAPALTASGAYYVRMRIMI